MARHPFGSGIADWTFDLANGVDGEDGLAQLATGVTVTLWDAQTGGSQYLDLLDANEAPVDHVLSSDGGDGYPAGTIPLFYGPDEVWHMWASADGGPRLLMLATDAGTFVAQVMALAASLQANFDAHLTAINPHSTALAQLADVNVGGATPGSALVLGGGGLWIAGDAGGLDATAFVGTTGGSLIRIADGDSTTQALLIRVPAGNRTAQSAPDTFAIEWNAGNDEEPDWRRTGWFNEFGELRAQASADNRVALRVKQRSNTQSANIAEFTTAGNDVLASIGPVGQVRGPNLMVAPWLFSTPAGNVSTGQGTYRIYNDTGVALTIRSVRASVGVAPTGADLIIDLNKNGTTCFATQANRPTIAAGQNTSGAVTAINTTSIAPGEYLTLDIDQVGSSEPGENLVVQIAVY